MSKKTAVKARSARTKWAQVVGSSPHSMSSDVRTQPACTTWRPVMSQRLFSMLLLLLPLLTRRRRHEPSSLAAKACVGEAVGCHLASVVLSSSSSSASEEVEEEEASESGRLELLHSSGLPVVGGRESMPSSEPVDD